MKRIIQLTIVIIVLMFFISGCNLKPNYYKEDVLYSEKDLSNYKSIDTDKELKDNLMTRQEAIDKAREVFKIGLNIDLSQMQVSESVRLFKQRKAEYFVWNIYWNKGEGGISYSCNIDSSTGEIISIDVSRYEEEKNLEEKYLHTSDEEVYNIISPLMTSLEINIKEYALINMWDEDDVYMYGEVKKLYEFRNINNEEEGFVIRVDCSRGKVLGYQKIIYNKEKIHY